MGQPWPLRLHLQRCGTPELAYATAQHNLCVSHEPLDFELKPHMYNHTGFYCHFNDIPPKLRYIQIYKGRRLNSLKTLNGLPVFSEW